MQNSDFVRSLRDAPNEKKRKTSFKFDLVLILLLLALSSIGVTTLFSATGENFNYVNRHIFFLGTGFLLMFIISQIPARSIELWSPYFFGITLILLLLVTLLGLMLKVRRGGST